MVDEGLTIAKPDKLWTGALVSGAATGCTSAGRVRQGHLIDLHQSCATTPIVYVLNVFDINTSRKRHHMHRSLPVCLAVV